MAFILYYHRWFKGMDIPFYLSDHPLNLIKLGFHKQLFFKHLIIWAKELTIAKVIQDVPSRQQQQKITLLVISYKYSRRSRRRPPRKSEKVVVTRAGRLREWALVSDRMIKQEILKNFQSGRSAYIRGIQQNSTLATNKKILSKMLKSTRCPTPHMLIRIVKADLHGMIFAYDCRMRFL